MPDLNIEYHRACSDLDYYQTIIKGSTQQYAVYCERGRWHCECKSFQFRGKCKHISEAEKKRCTWSDENSDYRVVENNGKHNCPICGGETFVYRSGV